MRIIAIVPGGQTKGNSPSEILIKEVAKQKPDWKVQIINLSFDNMKILNQDMRGTDLIWSDMDGLEVIVLGSFLSKKWNTKFYAHGEWVPPYRVLEGYSEKYLCETDLTRKPYYIKMLEAMQQADLVSFGLPYDSDGSFGWVKKNLGFEFKNYFVRHNYVKRYPYVAKERQHKVATIARVSDKKKRLVDTMQAVSMIRPEFTFEVVGANAGDIKVKNLKVNCLGVFDSDDKIEVYRTAALAVQHWSGIPPAEAMTQFCPVVAYECEEMKYDYGDTIIWAENGNVEDLAKKIVYVASHKDEMEKKVIDNYNKLCNNKLKVNFVDVRAKEVIKKIEGIL
jgi:glycosyltransferase involved in cell wall biosynthesis